MSTPPRPVKREPPKWLQGISGRFDGVLAETTLLQATGMDDNDFPSNDNNHAGSSQNGTTRTGLTLILPPLNAVRALKGKKKAAKTAFQDVVPVKKIPRPIKLKPLKEVLTKLISQIKKKDDYAFFLNPVDASQVQGYTDIVKNPMDLGTMTTKVVNGKYRSLEEFATDLRLVTNNAKLFNPPGTIYYTEADRIEAWALDHISKAAASVIEYETDWNIDIEHDEDAAIRDGGERDAEKMIVDGDDNGRGRSPSVASAQVPVQGSRKKGKKQPGMLSESLEEDGHLPGYRDGVGVFPPDSDWAELMLALKLKGKRYRTKKERMRMEKGGPPFAADGSIDYSEMEDPFTVLSTFLPEPLSKPLLTPLYPAIPPSASSSTSFPGSVALSIDRPLHEVRHPVAKKAPPGSITKVKRKHWTVSRNAAARRLKDRDEEDPLSTSEASREPEAVDHGSFAVLTGKLIEDAHTASADLTSADQLLDVIRKSLEGAPTSSPLDYTRGKSIEDYWTGWEHKADDYLKDVVYGGVDGYAYIRSLAEFVEPQPQSDEEMDQDDDKSACHSPDSLGMPLANWVAESVVDPLTEGRHRLLREIACHLNSSSSLHRPTHLHPDVEAQLDQSLHTHPLVSSHLLFLSELHTQKLDMAALIRKPEELFLADESWSGAQYMEEQRKRIEKEREAALVASPEKGAADYLAFAIESHREAEKPTSLHETREVLEYALGHSADEIARFANRKVDPTDSPLHDGQTEIHPDERMDVDTKEQVPAGRPKDEEDPDMKRVRLNLLALAKRARLDSIDKIPVDLVPPQIRHVVPTTEVPSNSSVM